jgi:FlaA1/EpsC-like NDP-sugar epimerase
LKGLKRVLREFLVVLRSVWGNAALFAALLIFTAILLRAAGCYREQNFGELLVTVFYISRFQSVTLPTNHHPLPAILVFVMPALTLLILGEGALRIVAVYLDRKRRGPAWEELMVHTLSGHTVVCGAGELGRALIFELLKRNPDGEIVVVDTHENILSELGLNVPNIHQIHGDMTSKQTLERANVAKAAIVVFASGDDAHNLEGATKALELNPDAEVHIRLYRIGLSMMMDKETRRNLHFFSPYQRAAEGVADHLGKKN